MLKWCIFFAIVVAVVCLILRTPRCGRGHGKIKMVWLRPEGFKLGELTEGEERYFCPICRRQTSRYLGVPSSFKIG